VEEEEEEEEESLEKEEESGLKGHAVGGRMTQRP